MGRINFVVPSFRVGKREGDKSYDGVNKEVHALINQSKDLIGA